jgi:hypothetical protein
VSPIVTCRPRRRRNAWRRGIDENTNAAIRQKILGVIFQPRCYRLFALPRELRDNVLFYRNVEYALEIARYPSSSLTNQSIASSRVPNLKNSRWEKVFSAW